MAGLLGQFVPREILEEWSKRDPSFWLEPGIKPVSMRDGFTDYETAIPAYGLSVYLAQLGDA